MNMLSITYDRRLFWRRVENLRRAALTAEDFEFRLLYYNQMIGTDEEVSMIQ